MNTPVIVSSQVLVRARELPIGAEVTTSCLKLSLVVARQDVEGCIGFLDGGKSGELLWLHGELLVWWNPDEPVFSVPGSVQGLPAPEIEEEEEEVEV